MLDLMECFPLLKVYFLEVEGSGKMILNFCFHFLFLGEKLVRL